MTRRRKKKKRGNLMDKTTLGVENRWRGKQDQAIWTRTRKERRDLHIRKGGATLGQEPC
jgi:hypothetical protein